MNKIKRIAIIAFDNKKTELIEWSYFNRHLLIPHQILAIAYAANVLEGTLNKKVEVSTAGKLGEYRDLCALINEEAIDAVIIFSDANEILRNKDLVGVVDAAIEHNIIVATNRTTADFVLNSSLIDSAYEVHKEEKKIAGSKSSFNVRTSFPLAKAS